MDGDRNPEENAPASALPAQPAAEAVERLLTDGWREYPDHLTHRSARCFYKRFDTPTPSQRNRERLGVQICLPVYEHEGRASFNLDLTAELPDGSWIRFHNYSLPSDLEACLKLIPRLLATWEFMAASLSL